MDVNRPLQSRVEAEFLCRFLCKTITPPLATKRPSRASSREAHECRDATGLSDPTPQARTAVRYRSAPLSLAVARVPGAGPGNCLGRLVQIGQDDPRIAPVGPLWPGRTARRIVGGTNPCIRRLRREGGRLG